MEAIKADYADFVFVEMQKAEKALKPCPFCGCQKVVILIDSEELYRYNLLRFRVVCEKCSAQINRGKIPQLVESWNRRVERGQELEGKQGV